MESMLETLFYLIAGHALGDFGLQTDWMARHKCRGASCEGESSSRPEFIWLHVLTAHCMIHAALVALVTGSILLGVLELIAHWIIDYHKCKNTFGFNTDQCLHLGCKLIWVLMLSMGIS